MKKLLLTPLVLCLLIAITPSVFALSFTDTVDLDHQILGEGTLMSVFHSNTYTYYHSTPGDFEVPFDVVNSATLSISAYWVNDNNDSIEVNGTVVGHLIEGGDYGWEFAGWKCFIPKYEFVDDPNVTTLDISSVFSSWGSGNPLAVTITANGSWGDYKLMLGSSTFALDYDNGTAPVPEPSTFLLLGSGLIGMLRFSRIKLKKKK